MPRSAVNLKYIPAPDHLEEPLPAEAITLVTNEGSGLTPALCQALTDRGHQVVVLTFPETLVRQGSHELPAGVAEVRLNDVTDETLQQVVANLAGTVGHFIFIHPHLRFPLGKLGMHFDKEKMLVRAGFLLAKHLKKPLNELAETHRVAFLTVTRLDGAMGTRNPGNVSVVGGGLFGLTKSLNLEWPKVFCRALDLAPELSAPVAAAKICSELLDADQRLTEAAYDAQGNRYTLVAEPMAPISEALLESTVNVDSVFLVTGGARGVTADCVRQMAETFRCKFILVGRSELAAAEPAWAQGVQDAAELKRKAMEALLAAGEKPLPKTVQRMVGAVQAQREIQENLAFIRRQGAEVHYCAADVTNAEALRTALDQVTPTTGKITGIIHGAGRLADKLIENKTEADFDAVYDVKIQGLLAAVQAVSIEDIRHVVLFSSVAGFYGNVGQTDYAIANEVLNRTAHLFHKNHPDVHVVSINWGAWDGGMVSPELKKLFSAHNVSLVPSQEGPLALVDQLSTRFSDQAQVILGGTLPMAKAPTDGPLRTYLVHRHLTVSQNPFLSHHVIQGHAVLPIINSSTWMAQTTIDLYPGFYLHRVLDVKLFKGIVFDGSQPETFQVKVEEKEKGAERIVVEVTISSDSGKKLPLHHYRSTVVLGNQPPVAPVEVLPDLSRLTPVVDDASVIYEDGTLFHGPDFRGVKKVLDLHREGALLLCEHPGVTAERQGQFPVKDVNAFLTDIMYQGLLVWVRRFHGSASLPLRTEAVEIYKVLPFGKPFYVALKVIKADDFAMEADITAFDAVTGEVYMRSRRAGVTISRDLRWS